MTVRQAIARLVANEDLNFLLTNRLPRRLATNFVGWFSKIENPIVAKSSIALWKLFSDVDLADAAETKFPSMHACFIRTLKPEARPAALPGSPRRQDRSWPAQVIKKSGSRGATLTTPVV